MQSSLRTDAPDVAPSVIQINEDGNNEEAKDKQEWKVAKINSERPKPIFEIDDKNNNRHRMIKVDEVDEDQDINGNTEELSNNKKRNKRKEVKKI